MDFIRKVKQNRYGWGLELEWEDQMGEGSGEGIQGETAKIDENKTLFSKKRERNVHRPRVCGW